MQDPKEIQRLSYLKAIKLEKLIDEVEKRINKSSSNLTKLFLKVFLNKLNVENGRILDKLDKNTTTLFNQAYGQYSNTTKIELIKSFVSDINSILGDNEDFYKKTTKVNRLQVDDIRWIVNRRLGIETDGSLIKDGYMNGLLNDSGIKSDLQKFIFKEIFKGTGPEALRIGLKNFIEGNENRLGAFTKHYRAFTFDVYAQLNSFTSALYAEKLGLYHFIYNGGLIKTSRKFCIKRNAGVYSTDEAEEWVNDPDLTAITNKENYNWVVDRGGYNCRHTIDYIAKEVAYVMRPELKEIDIANKKKKIDSITESLAKEAARNVNIDLTGGLVEVMQRIRNVSRKIMSDREIETFKNKYGFEEYLKTKGTLYKSKLEADKFLTPHGRKELDTIIKILDRGIDFYVMPQRAIGKSSGELPKNLDGFIFNKNSYKAVEIKTLSTGNRLTVADRIAYAGEQSNKIILDITGSISQKDLAYGIRNGMNNNKRISSIELLYSGKRITISRREIINEKKYLESFLKKIR